MITDTYEFDNEPSKPRDKVLPSNPSSRIPIIQTLLEPHVEAKHKDITLYDELSRQTDPDYDEENQEIGYSEIHKQSDDLNDPIISDKIIFLKKKDSLEKEIRSLEEELEIKKERVESYKERVESYKKKIKEITETEMAQEKMAEPSKKGRFDVFKPSSFSIFRKKRGGKTCKNKRKTRKNKRKTRKNKNKSRKNKRKTGKNNRKSRRY
jgi:hypothetical protein